MGLFRNLSRMVAPAVKAVASAKPPIGAPLSNQNMGFLGQAPQKIISAVKNSAPAQNVGPKIGQHLSNDFFKQAGPLIGNALGKAFNQSRPSTGGTLEQMPEVTTTRNNAPMPSNVNTGFFKKGGKVKNYTTKDGKLNLSAGGVSTASKNKSCSGW